MRLTLPKRSLLLLTTMALFMPTGAEAQRNAREILSDHSCILQAGDLTIQFIYLHPDSLGREIAKLVLRSDEFLRFDQERTRLQEKWSLLALRVTPFREARFDPTQIRLTERENTHQVGFMDLVDVQGLFTSTVTRGDNVFGFIKVPER
ncbi:hypothetical protein ACFL39_02275, partial [Gemmatimonadota bacterium]